MNQPPFSRIPVSDSDALMAQAAALLQAGKREEAEKIYLAVLAAEPKHAEASARMGTLLAGSDRAQLALPHLRVALEARPRQGADWQNYIEALALAGQVDAANQMLAQAQRRGIGMPDMGGLAKRLESRGQPNATPAATQLMELALLFSQSRFAEMEQAARSLTAQHPGNGMGWKALGTALAAQAREAEAVPAMQTAASLLPGEAEVHINLGNLLHEMNRLEAAEASYRRAIDIDARNAEAHRPLSITLRDLGQLEAAEASSRRALQLNPRSYAAISSLIRVLHAQGRLAEAEAHCREALQQHPDSAEAHYDLATLQSEQFRFAEAESAFRTALELKPGYVAAMNNLGSVLNETGQFTEAEALLRKAHAVNPQLSNVLCNLSGALNGQHRHTEADACLDKAISLRPLDTKAFSMLLFSLNYAARHSPAYRLERAREFGRAVRTDAKFSSWQCAGTPARLRVGIVSGDFGNHPVGYFLESLVANIDAARIELFAYPTTHKNDALTARIKPRFSAWNSIAGISDQAAARRIHDDGIHVLIDLSGHTAGNRLPVFAFKPAPVQASWLGYFAATGVEEMDYLIADETGVGKTQRTQFTETILYLPQTRLCFTPPAGAPDVSPLPAARNGYVTFGCFQNLSKVGDEVLALWAGILAALPDARLRMQCRELGHAFSRDQLLQRMRAQGMPIERIALHGRVSRDAYLSSYGEVDMLLDTFPYPGGTTTCEALWMGVPTLTLAPAEGSLLERQGASLLVAAGLADWIAEDGDAYVERAVAFANDKLALANLRAGMRERVRVTPLFDAPRFARDVEQLLWTMWDEGRDKFKL